jgi:hypothetical protein
MQTVAAGVMYLFFLATSHSSLATVFFLDNLVIKWYTYSQRADRITNPRRKPPFGGFSLFMRFGRF